MPNPYDLYIRFLATTGVDELSELNRCLESVKLFPVAQSDLDQQWELIHRALPANIVTQIEQKSYSADFMKNMGVLEVSELWLYRPPFRNGDPTVPYVRFVYDNVLTDTWLKVCINALLIKKVSIEEISRILSSKFSIALKERHVDIYSRFFFDSSRMTRAAWKGYTKRCAGKEAHIYFTALTEGIDVLKTELDLPAIVNISDSLQWLLTKSFMKAKTFMNIGTLEASREAREWIDQVVKLTDKYEKHRSGDQHDFAKALQMEFEFVEEKFDTPDSDIASELAQKALPKGVK